MTARAPVGGEELEVLRSFARRIDPSDAGAYNNLGVLYYRKGLTDDAIAAFSRALALDERMRVARRNLEIAYGESGTQQRGIEQLRARLERNPNDVEALVQSGIAEKTSGDLRRAQQLFERAIELDPQSSVLHFSLAETLYNRGLHDEALKAVRRSLTLHPENPDALYLLGFILGDLGRNDEAAIASRKALALNPTLTRAEANLSLESRPDGGPAAADGSAGEGPAQNALALAYRQKGYYDEALRAYEKAAESPDSEQQALRGILEIHLLRRDAEAAIAAGQRVTEKYPASARILNHYGVALQMAGRHEEAGEQYSLALAIDEQYPFAHNNAGVVLWHDGEQRDAVNEFRRAMQATPCPIEARLNLALALFRQKHFDLALEAYRQVFRTDRDHPVAWNGIGLILVDLERFEEARNAFARAIQSRPEFAEAHYNMSFTLTRLGDFNGALRETKQALALDPVYSAQKLALAVELPHEETALFVGPALADSADRGQGIPDFHFDPKILEELFAPAPATDEPQAEGGSFSLARDYVSKGLPDRAHAEIARVLARGGNRLEGLLLAGESFRSQGLLGEALERFNEALDIEPANRDALRGSAQSLLALGRANEAIGVAERLAHGESAAPTDLLLAAEALIATGQSGIGRETLERAASASNAIPADLAHAATLFTSLGDHGRAVEMLRKAVKIEPTNVAIRVALARALVAIGDDPGAGAELRSALDLDASNQNAQLELVSIYRRRNEPKAALNLLVRLLHDDVYHFEALILLGETLLDLGRDRDASRSFERVLRFDPSHRLAREYLEKLSAGVA